MAYIAAILASNAWAVQILDVAFSRRICCYLVWSAILNAGLSSLSFERPIILPGILRTFSFLVAKNPEYGPPNPIGTPNLWADPKLISAPISPGALVNVNASKSEATTLTILSPFLSILLKKSVKSCTTPFESGVWTTTPKNSSGLLLSKKVEYFPMTTSISRNFALVWMTDWVGIKTF